jgi:hypothetical protein
MSAAWRDFGSNDKAATLLSFTVVCLCVATLRLCRECFLVLRILNFRSWLKFPVDLCLFNFVLDPS